DVGGRYSALSYVGLVPAALLGIDLPRLLDRARRMRLACGPAVAARENPGLHLGAALGALARAGRDKLTLVASERVAAFGAWVEQLIAESTGKEGTGIVPVDGEPLGRPAAYGKDRVFVYLRLGPRHDRAVRTLARAGHPVVTLGLVDAYDLGGEFLRWEIATAAAAWVLGIDPFDQPDVQLAKDNTVRLLGEYAASGRRRPALRRRAGRRAGSGRRLQLRRAGAGPGGRRLRGARRARPARAASPPRPRRRGGARSRGAGRAARRGQATGASAAAAQGASDRHLTRMTLHVLA